MSHERCTLVKKKGKVLPYSLPSVGLGADPGVQAVSPWVAFNRPPGSWLPLLSARPAVTFPVEVSHRPSASSNYIAWQQHMGVNNLPKVLTARRPGIELATTESPVRCLSHKTIESPCTVTKKNVSRWSRSAVV